MAAEEIRFGGCSGRDSFAAGLLWKTTWDYPAAKALSSRLFSAPAFEPVSEELLEQAMRCMDGCRKVICCRESFGTLEDAPKELLAWMPNQGGFF